jgi:hypothetical protein
MRADDWQRINGDGDGEEVSKNTSTRQPSGQATSHAQAVVVFFITLSFQHECCAMITTAPIERYPQTEHPAGCFPPQQESS